jgi:hypothetical protein
LASYLVRSHDVAGHFTKAFRLLIEFHGMLVFSDHRILGAVRAVQGSIKSASSVAYRSPTPAVSTIQIEAPGNARSYVPDA